MSGTIAAFAACGAAGALIYSFPVYLKSVSQVPPAEYALLNCVFSVFVGCVFAALFTNPIGYHFRWTIEPEPWPLAAVIGLGSNPLVPIIVGRLQQFAQNFGGFSK